MVGGRNQSKRVNRSILQSMPRLRAHKADLLKHAKTKLHIGNIKRVNPVLNKQSTLNNHVVQVTNAQEEKDLKIAMHSAIRSVDHLSNIFIEYGKGSMLGNIKLHRTKCSSTIKPVVF